MSSPTAWVCMTSLLFNKVAVQLAHLLHARLSPLTFLLNLSLLTLLVRIILSFNASTPTLHTIITTFLQSFNLNLLNALVANFIIIALFFTSKGASSDHALMHHAYMTHFEVNDDEDDSKPYDTLAITTANHELDADKFYDALAIITNDLSSNELAIATNDIPSSELTAPSRELATSSASPMIPYNQLELVHTSQEKSSKKSRLHTDDMNFCVYSYDKPCNTLANLATAPSMELIACRPSNSMLSNEEEELVPTKPQENSSEKSLIRCRSDNQITRDCNHVANNYKYYGRTVSCTYYYELEACSTTRMYTASVIDSLSKEEANKCFSEFTSRKWAKIRMESQADCEESPPSTSLCISAQQYFLT